MHSKGCGCFLSAVCLFALVASSCGYLGEKGKEPRGDVNQPVSGVGKFEKQDFYCGTQLVQPFLIEDKRSSSVISGEPWLLNDEGAIRVWWVARDIAAGTNTVLTAEIALSAGTECRSVDAALKNIREVRFVPSPSYLIDAPTVVKKDGHYLMWFSKGTWQGIGHAVSDDGLDWEILSENVLEPNQTWENGSVGSPSVLWVDPGLVRAGGVFRFRMWYEGNVFGRRAIGHAESTDGLEWIKTDASGAREPARGPAPGSVRPVLEATQNNWEFWNPGDPWGRVGQPCVIVHQSPTRPLFYMYYTGNIYGRIEPDAIAGVNLVLDCFAPCRGRDACMDASIGLASSEDGLTWDKAASFSEPNVIANEINPIMNEKFPVSLDPRKPEGSINVFCPNFIVDEAEPAVLEVVENQLFIMLFHQVDFMNLMEGASLPPEDPAVPSTFTGASGIGFSYVGNTSF